MSITKLVCLGDSLTEGYGLDSSKRWTSHLEKLVPYPIINSGISGDTTAGMLARFNQDVLYYKPSHLIVMGGTNDIHHRLDNNSILSNLYAISRQAMFHKITMIIGLPTPVIVDDLDVSDSIFIQGHDLKVRMQALCELYKRFAEEKDEILIDFGKDLGDDMFLDDGVHINEKGQIQMAANAHSILKTLQ